MKSVLPSPQTEVKAIRKTSRQDDGNANKNKKSKHDDQEYIVNIQRGESEGQIMERRVKFKQQQIDLAIKCGFSQEHIQKLNMELYEMLSKFNENEDKPPSNINSSTPSVTSTSSNTMSTSSSISTNGRRSDVVLSLNSQLAFN